METESAPKPQTGGLKLMTVFIVVLALHVVVIGGISAYHLFKPTGGDSAGSISQKDPATEATEAAKTDTTAEPLQAENSAPTPSDTQVTDSTTPPAPANPHVITPPVPPAPANGGTTPAPAPTQTHEVKAPVVPDSGEKTSMVEVTVKAGDSLYKIAKQNHATVDSIKKLNGLASDNLKIGQKLKVAAKGAPAAPAQTAVATAIASAQSNIETAKTAVAKTAKPAASNSTVYTVAKGDNLTKIARHFKTTPTAIMSANKMTDPKKLSIGAKLKIPVQQVSSETTPATPSNAANAKPAIPAPAASADLVSIR